VNAKRDILPLVALIGRPNVGKSSLFNRIVGGKEAIVDPTPGVTRDRHHQRVSVGDRSFILVDTGGLDPEAGDVINRMIQEQTWQAIEEADVILFLLDGREGLLPDDERVADTLRRSGKQVFYLVNKVDDPGQEVLLVPPFYALGVEKLWPVSAAHGHGVKVFLEELAAALPQFPSHETEEAEGAVALAFVGRPNAGKSSLVNRLVGEERMVVSQLPGTTRDAVDCLCERKGRRYLLIDTAGIRRKGKVREKVERFSVMRTLAALERCDIGVVVVDSSLGMTDQDAKVIGYTLERGRGCLVLLNKWDLLKNDRKRQTNLLDEVERATGFAGFVPVLKVSAMTGAGVEKIFPLADEIHRQFSFRVGTAEANRILEEAVAAHPPPMVRGRRLKFYYATQVVTRPPTLVVVTNFPKDVHFSYERYLVNVFRKRLGLDKVMLRLIFRERKGRGGTRKR